LNSEELEKNRANAEDPDAAFMLREAEKRVMAHYVYQGVRENGF
jgi:hypothetical protein